MFVIKRDGRKERVMFDKITARINKLAYDLDMRFVETTVITQKVISGVFTGVKTTQLDNLAAETAAYLTTQHPDYAVLAARIAVSNLHKETKKAFSLVMIDLYNHINPNTNKHTPLISKELFDVIMSNADRLNSAIIYDRDYSYSYFGFKTLEKSYLMRINDVVVERPQHMLMRVALGIHMDDIDAAIETYDLMSEKWFTHATPTLFNAGTPRPQMSSCFLVQMQSDSIEGIYDTIKTSALISKSAGGVGLSIHKIRASGSFIAGTGGFSNGLIPMLRVFNDTARFVTQGGGKRNGSFAVYLEPWHSDIFEFLDLRKNTGAEAARARDLFLGLWIPDLFMQRVEANTHWSLFCPAECPGLHECVGDKFKELYEQYEHEGRARKTIKAQELWFAILDAQIETGNPYMLYKDACNLKSNQQNLGVIQCSNLCTEIIEYTAPDEVAVCNLASLALPKFVNKQTKTFDFQKLFEVSKVITRNLNKVIDRNWYPVEAARRSNMRHRPIGLGVQGLADAFIMMRLPFESPEASQLNEDIFETIYFGAMTASMELAQKDGPYETYPGSPVSQGKFQFDLWNTQPKSGRWDWTGLKVQVAKHGVRNSLLLAPMPTASTAQILGNNESFEPYTSNIYSRRVLSGEFQVVNHHLLRDLTELGLWDSTLRNKIIANNGSVQNIMTIPQDIRELYKTAWEVSQRKILDMAADRSPYIDQSQSLNVFMPAPTIAKLTSMHFHGWKRGLKTGMYYLRIKPAADAIKFTVDQAALTAANESTDTSIGTDEQKNENKPVFKASTKTDAIKVAEADFEAVLLCSRTNKDECVMCSG